MEQQYDRLLEALETCERGSTEFLKIVDELELLAESGYYEACEILAELMAIEQSVRDPRMAYFWYYIALKHQGFRTGLELISDNAIILKHLAIAGTLKWENKDNDKPSSY